jgi:pantetheine-phosphate adenylyltransferase
METIEQRMEGVREFLELFRPQIEHDVVPISDVYGPTSIDPDIQALVVSKETIAGGESSKWYREPQ